MIKNDIRYRTGGIIIFLLLVSLLSIVPNYFLKLDSFFDTNYLNSIVSERFYEVINNSLYREQGQYYRNGLPDENLESYFNYYIKTDKILNYPMTEKFIELNDNTIYGMTRTGEYIYYGSLAQARDGLARNDVVTVNVLEPQEPINGSTYLTNDTLFKNKYGDDFKFNPDNLDFKEGFTVVSGKWNVDKLDVSTPEISDMSSEDKLFTNIFVNTIKKIYNGIIPRENGIENISFAYLLNTDAPAFKSFVENSKFRAAFAPATLIMLLISMAIFLFFGFITNYDIASEVGFYKGIRKFPIEVVLTLIGLWFIPVVGGFSIANYGYNFSVGAPIITLFAIAQVILVFFGGIAILYFVHAFKSMFKEGKSSFLYGNSVIGRLLRSIFGFGKSSIRGYTNNLEGTSKTAVIFVYSVLIIIGYFGTRLFVNYDYRNLVFVLWFLLISGMFVFFKSYYDNIKEIEYASKSIAMGNYDVKVDEVNSKFKTLSHSLNTISDNLDNAVENALKSERMKTELITNVSHDLKTPLTSIINYSELIMDSDVEENVLRDYAKVINEKSHRLKTLIESLFEVSKLSSNNVDLNLENLNFSQLVEQVLGEWEDKLVEKNIDTNVNLPADPIYLNLDGTQTSRILENVFSNINKYAQENTRVYVDLYNRDDIELVVKNISKYPLNISADELMERFTRGDESRTTEGSGLGLSIADSLTKIQGGDFKISIDGDLFKVTVSFPKNVNEIR